MAVPIRNNKQAEYQYLTGKVKLTGETLKFKDSATGDLKEFTKIVPDAVAILKNVPDNFNVVLTVRDGEVVRVQPALGTYIAEVVMPDIPEDSKPEDIMKLHKKVFKGKTGRGNTTFWFYAPFKIVQSISGETTWKDVVVVNRFRYALEAYDLQKGTGIALVGDPSNPQATRIRELAQLLNLYAGSWDDIVWPKDKPWAMEDVLKQDPDSAEIGNVVPQILAKLAGTKVIVSISNGFVNSFEPYEDAGFGDEQNDEEDFPW